MADITQIPLGELLQDLEESRNDIVACETGLKIGVTHYRGENGKPKSVAERLRVNQKIVEIIHGELARRGVTVVQVLG